MKYRVWLLPRTLRLEGPNLYGHPSDFLNFHPPWNLVANRLFRAMGAAFGRIWIWHVDLTLRQEYVT